MDTIDFYRRLEKEIDKQDTMLSHSVILANEETIIKLKASPPSFYSNSCNSIPLRSLESIKKNKNIYVKSPHIPDGKYYLVENEELKESLLKKENII